MTEEDAFLLDLLARPDDEASRLIYADWLLDRDDPRAELVRAAYELRGVRATKPARLEHAARWREARQKYGWQEYDGLLLTWEQMVTVFRFRLAEVIAYCGGDRPLRTWELEPRALVGRTSADWPWQPERDEEPVWLEMLHELAIVRRQSLERAGRAPSRLPTHLASGRILLRFPASRPSDHMIMDASRGFFDDAGFPPWDNWVMFLPAYQEPNGDHTPACLFAWVPPAWWLHHADQGIRVAPPSLILWSRESTLPFVRYLRQAGISGV